MQTQCDFYSKAGFKPSMWGPGTWHLIHVTAANYPCNPTQEDRRRTRHFLVTLADMLPCASCRCSGRSG